LEDFDLYITSVYFTTTTIVTVGYGDIGPFNTAEKLVCILLMLIGVISFTFATGALSSIISSYDSSQAKLKEKTDVLNMLKKDYHLGEDLYESLMKTIKYDYSKN
jgi:hyperpolarization activated cyclic nucleotide-gated potassium channel 2